MRMYAKLNIGLTHELKNLLSELPYEASDILREAVQRALVSLDVKDLSDLPQIDFKEKINIRTDFETFVLVRTLRRPDRKKFYALVNDIALSLAKERLELRREIREKLTNLGKEVSDGG